MLFMGGAESKDYSLGTEIPEMRRSFLLFIIFILCFPAAASALSEAFKQDVFDPGELKPVDSKLKVHINDEAPDFTLKAVSGKSITLSQFRGKKNVVLSFVPAAWTPVCSDQWPGYNIAKPLFELNDAVLLGITVDNIATLFAWTRQMGKLWFEVLSDFYPHGRVSDVYGILRSDGVSERALFIIDKTGRIRFVHVEDINRRPDLGKLINALKAINH